MTRNPESHVGGQEPEAGSKLLCEVDCLQDFASELESVSNTLPQRVNVDPEKVEQGLAQLVLTLIELLRRLMERQAIRRVEAGSLSDEEIERLGETFIKLQGRMDELREVFGLEEEDLNLNLGPLGDLM